MPKQSDFVDAIEVTEKLREQRKGVVVIDVTDLKTPRKGASLSDVLGKPADRTKERL